MNHVKTVKTGHALSRLSKQSILTLLISGLLLQVSFPVNAQNPKSFAGKWELDHSKSAPEFKDYQVTCSISQSTAAITVEQLFVMSNGDKSSMPPITFNLDSKEVATEEQGGTNKISASLSADGKTLTTKYVRTMNGADYGSITIYSLSDDGKLLTVKTSDLNNESPMVQVYNRK